MPCRCSCQHTANLLKFEFCHWSISHAPCRISPMLRLWTVTLPTQRPVSPARPPSAPRWRNYSETCVVARDGPSIALFSKVWPSFHSSSSGRLRSSGTVSRRLFPTHVFDLNSNFRLPPCRHRFARPNESVGNEAVSPARRACRSARRRTLPLPRAFRPYLIAAPSISMVQPSSRGSVSDR